MSNRRHALRTAFATLAVGLFACGGTRPETGQGTARAPAKTTAAATIASLTFAVIGDFGDGGTSEGDVAKLVKGWSPDFVVTVGDNNYPDGAADTIDTNIGQFYSDFIGGYTGTYGTGSVENRFWPVLGNHDWRLDTIDPYVAYFPKLPGNQRYYEKDFGGLVRVFAVDSDPHEPDGIDSASVQADWIKAHMTASTSCFNFAFMHHSPYSSADKHGSYTDLQWPYKAWGADGVFSGHDHDFERLEVDGLPYFVNGVGGADLNGFRAAGDVPPPEPGSKFKYSSGWGAQLVSVTKSGARVEFWNSAGEKVDTYTISKSCP